jgi:hypothetical protein
MPRRLEMLDGRVVADRAEAALRIGPR